MDHGLFLELLIVLATSVAAVALLHRLRLPPILGYLVAGLLIGPGGLGLIHNETAIAGLAEFGVVFLLFTLGLEFSLPRLLAMRGIVFGFGGAQVVTCTAAFLGLSLLLGQNLPTALVIAAALALSSTALVARELAVLGELHTRHGQLAMGVLLFQDLAAVVLLILIPALTGAAPDGLGAALVSAFAKGVALVALLLAVGKWLLPPLFDEVARTRSHELFALTALVVALLAAAATERIGLSMALGAFIGGMMLGESHYRHQVEVEIRPFRDLLLGIFFVSVGMLVDVRVLLQTWHWILLLTLGVLAVNFLIVAALGRLMGETTADATRTAIVLSQAGEFGFALLALALTNGLIASETNGVVLAIVVLTMAVTPLLVRHNRQLVTLLLRNNKPSTRHSDQSDGTGAPLDLRDHVVICGFGRVGQSVARFLKREKVPYVAIDPDPQRVDEAAGAGEPVRYGDGARQAVLEKLGVGGARLVVISFSDTQSSLRVLRAVRAISPDIPVLVRTTDDRDLEALIAAGATDVIPEVLEASLTLAARMLSVLGLAPQRVIDAVREVRDERYQLLHGFYHGNRSRVLDARGRELEVLHPIRLPAKARAAGMRVGDLNLDAVGATLEALRRGEEELQDPPADLELRADDVLVLRGTSHTIEAAEAHLLGG